MGHPDPRVLTIQDAMDMMLERRRHQAGWDFKRNKISFKRLKQIDLIMAVLTEVTLKGKRKRVKNDGEGSTIDYRINRRDIGRGRIFRSMGDNVRDGYG